jgi:hypothetical protein
MSDPRFSEKAVARYESILASVLRNPSTDHHFDPSLLGLSAETASARLRDAARAIIEGKVSRPELSSLADIWPLFFVRIVDNHVHILRKERPIVSSAVVTATINNVKLAIPTTDETSLTAAAHLLHHHYLTCAVELIGDLSDHLRTQLTTNRDIAIVRDPNGSWRMF